MPQKRHTVDQIVAKLRKADVEVSKGKKVPEICNRHTAPCRRIHRHLLNTEVNGWWLIPTEFSHIEAQVW